MKPNEIGTDDIYRLMRVIEALNGRVAELEAENARLWECTPSDVRSGNAIDAMLMLKRWQSLGGNSRVGPRDGGWICELEWNGSFCEFPGKTMAEAVFNSFGRFAFHIGPEIKTPPSPDLPD